MTEQTDSQMEDTAVVFATPQPPEGPVRIADEHHLEQWAQLPTSERQLTPQLRGVLAEIALTGTIRYSWSLLRPLVEFAMDQVLQGYERAAEEEGPGPPRPAFPNEDLHTTAQRFRRCLSRFARAPWTLQRLCEVLLAPQNQYRRLHKVALAIEKCLMVTSEVGVTQDAPPPPYLSDLGPVNVNPPKPLKDGADHGHRDMDVEGRGSAFTSTLFSVHGEPPTSNGYLGSGDSSPNDSPPGGANAAGAGAAGGAEGMQVSTPEGARTGALGGGLGSGPHGRWDFGAGAGSGDAGSPALHGSLLGSGESPGTPLGLSPLLLPPHHSAGGLGSGGSDVLSPPIALASPSPGPTPGSSGAPGPGSGSPTSEPHKHPQHQQQQGLHFGSSPGANSSGGGGTGISALQGYGSPQSGGHPIGAGGSGGAGSPRGHTPGGHGHSIGSNGMEHHELSEDAWPDTAHLMHPLHGGLTPPLHGAGAAAAIHAHAHHGHHGGAHHHHTGSHSPNGGHSLSESLAGGHGGGTSPHQHHPNRVHVPTALPSFHQQQQQQQQQQPQVSEQGVQREGVAAAPASGDAIDISGTPGHNQGPGTTTAGDPQQLHAHKQQGAALRDGSG